MYFEHQPGTEHKAGSDGNVHHRGCTGKWRGEVTVNVGGKQVRRRVSAKTKTEVYSRLKDLQDELGQGVRTSGSYTVADAVDDWLDGPMADRSPKTVQTLRELLSPLTSVIGRTVLRDLTADDVSGALRTIAGTRSHLSSYLIRIHPRRIVRWNIDPARPGLQAHDLSGR